MNCNYLFLASLISAVGLFTLHLTRNDVPWYLTAILCLNFMLLIISSSIKDEKDRQRDKRIKQLEKELQELKKKENEND